MADEPHKGIPAAPATIPAAPAAPARSQRQFDVALVDPNDPSLEHWPRLRVTIDAASVDDLDEALKKPPPGGESQEAEAKRLAWLVAEIERQRAVAAYNVAYGLTDSHLRYDVVPAAPGSPPPVEPERWQKYRKSVGLLRS